MIDIMLKILFVCVGKLIFKLFENHAKHSFYFLIPGNSCRSPMAEAVLRNLTTANIINASAEPQWLIDSAALADWNVGRLPEPRAIQVLANNGLHSEHIARQVILVKTNILIYETYLWSIPKQITEDDFYQFDYIFGMDDMNIEHLLTMSPPDATARIELLGRYDYGRPEVIADPYFVSIFF